MLSLVLHRALLFLPAFQIRNLHRLPCYDGLWYLHPSHPAFDELDHLPRGQAWPGELAIVVTVAAVFHGLSSIWFGAASHFISRKRHTTTLTEGPAWHLHRGIPEGSSYCLFVSVIEFTNLPRCGGAGRIYTETGSNPVVGPGETSVLSLLVTQIIIVVAAVATLATPLVQRHRFTRLGLKKS